MITAIVIVEIFIKRDRLSRLDDNLHLWKRLLQLLNLLVAFLALAEHLLGAEGGCWTRIPQQLVVTLIIVTLSSRIVLSILLLGEHHVFDFFFPVIDRRLLTLRVIVARLNDLLVEVLIGAIVHFNHVLHVSVLLAMYVRGELRKLLCLDT